MSRGSSLKFQSPASLGGLFGRTQGTKHTGRAAGPGQPSRQPGWAANWGAGAVVWGPCRQWVPSTLLRASWEEQPLGMASRWLQRAGHVPASSRAMRAHGFGRSSSQCWLQTAATAAWLARKVRSAHKHIPVQAVLHSITALSSITWEKSLKLNAVYNLFHTKLSQFLRVEDCNVWRPFLRKSNQHLKFGGRYSYDACKRQQAVCSASPHTLGLSPSTLRCPRLFNDLLRTLTHRLVLSIQLTHSKTVIIWYEISLTTVRTFHFFSIQLLFLSPRFHYIAAVITY